MLYYGIVQTLVRHNATDRLLEDMAGVLLTHNPKFELGKYWEYVRTCRLYQEDL